MILGSLIPIAILAAIVTLIVRAFGNRESSPTEDSGVSIRRFFQYAILLSVVIVVAIGATGLLTELIPGDTVIRGDTYARSIAFLVVGIPVLYALARWTKKSLTSIEERESVMWGLYLTVAALTGLITAGVAAFELGRAALSISSFESRDLALLIAWGAVWVIHYRIAEAQDRTGRLRLHLIGGSLVGLIAVAIAIGFGLSAIISQIYESLFEVRVTGSSDDIAQSAIGLIIGGAIWWRYWLSVTSRLARDWLWHGYVLLAGVLGGLVTFLTGAGALLFMTLDWFFGGTGDTAAVHFEGLPPAIGTLIAGGVLWLYHRSVLAAKDPAPRAETDRVYDYLVAAVGLLAAASGITIVVVALIQSIFPGDITGRGGSQSETLLGAITLLLIGGPVWWQSWSGIQHERNAAPQIELVSPTRRIYVFGLFGLGGVTALISLLTLVVGLLEDALDGALSGQTIFENRVSIALIVTVGALAGYHWSVHKEDRSDAPADEEGVPIPIVSSAVLVSSDGAEVGAEVTHQTGVRVRIWDQPQGSPASVEDVLEAVRTGSHPRLLIIARDGGVETLPFTERR